MGDIRGSQATPKRRFISGSTSIMKVNTASASTDRPDARSANGAQCEP
jgi:hypothetical protein